MTYASQRIASLSQVTDTACQLKGRQRSGDGSRVPKRKSSHYPGKSYQDTCRSQAASLSMTQVDLMVPSDWKDIVASVSADTSATLYARARFWGPSTPPSMTATLALHTSSLTNISDAEVVIKMVSYASCSITIWSYMCLDTGNVLHQTGLGCPPQMTDTSTLSFLSSLSHSASPLEPHF